MLYFSSAFIFMLQIWALKIKCANFYVVLTI
nr:MAG TPA: hypothetical protein [Caudoviricetes sp.]